MYARMVEENANAPGDFPFLIYYGGKRQLFYAIFLVILNVFEQLLGWVFKIVKKKKGKKINVFHLVFKIISLCLAAAAVTDCIFFFIKVWKAKAGHTFSTEPEYMFNAVVAAAYSAGLALYTTSFLVLFICTWAKQESVVIDSNQLWKLTNLF